MIIISIIYLILLLWMFDFVFLKDTETNGKKSDNHITVIINKIYDIEQLLGTLDSIKLQNTKSKLELILVDYTNDDLQLIVTPYNNIFESIHVYKADYYDIDTSTIKTNNILIIENGMELSNNFIHVSLNYFNQLDISVMFFPKILKLSNRTNIFFQLYESFKQTVKCSLINKNIYRNINFNDDCLIIVRDLFIEKIENKNSNFSNHNYKYVMDSNLCIYSSKTDSSVKFFFFFYFGMNVFFLIVMTLFISMPSIKLLIALSIKIIPELYYIYSYYNKLTIKFPKIDFMIYSVIIPFYMFLELFLIRNNLRK